MKIKTKLLLTGLFLTGNFLLKAQPSIAPVTLHNFKTVDINGEVFDFATLKGKKILIVNTASECGFTPQYAELEKLYQKYKDKNFIIIGFPANNFKNQEPGSNNEIKFFCQKNYGISFPMMSKVSVRGSNKDKIYEWLTKEYLNEKKNVEVTWNFQKFMVDEQGRWVNYAEPKTPPNSPEIINWIEGK